MSLAVKHLDIITSWFLKLEDQLIFVMKKIL